MLSAALVSAPGEFLISSAIYPKPSGSFVSFHELCGADIPLPFFAKDSFLPFILPKPAVTCSHANSILSISQYSSFFALMPDG